MPETESLPNNYPIHSAKWLGSNAQLFVKKADASVILGVTSKGVFLQNESREIVFISGEVFRGPLTINLDGMMDFKSLIAVGEKCLINNGRLSFTCCRVLLNDAQVWEPPKIVFQREDIRSALQRGIELAIKLIDAYRDGLFCALLDALINQPDAVSRQDLWDLIPKLNNGEPAKMLEGLLGLGGGLTPSGDDFICGYLLANYYLRKACEISNENMDNADRLVTLAKTKTTYLSAALICCAAQGRADERVMNALRWIAEGEGEAGLISEELRTYGSSSALDTLAGMLGALLRQHANSYS